MAKPCYECQNYNHVDCVLLKPNSKKKCGCLVCHSPDSKYKKLYLGVK